MVAPLPPPPPARWQQSHRRDRHSPAIGPRDSSATSCPPQNAVPPPAGASLCWAASPRRHRQASARQANRWRARRTNGATSAILMTPNGCCRAVAVPTAATPWARPLDPARPFPPRHHCRRCRRSCYHSDHRRCHGATNPAQRPKRAVAEAETWWVQTEARASIAWWPPRRVLGRRLSTTHLGPSGCIGRAASVRTKPMHAWLRWGYALRACAPCGRSRRRGPGPPPTPVEEGQHRAQSRQWHRARAEFAGPIAHGRRAGAGAATVTSRPSLRHQSIPAFVPPPST